jgi:hypothetical protein
MSRYFFDIDDGSGLRIDDVGVSLADRKSVRDEAIAILPAVAKEVLPDGDSHDLSVHVRDESGTLVFKAKLCLTSQWLS